MSIGLSSKCYNLEGCSYKMFAKVFERFIEELSINDEKYKILICGKGYELKEKVFYLKDFEKIAELIETGEIDFLLFEHNFGNERHSIEVMFKHTTATIYISSDDTKKNIIYEIIEKELKLEKHQRTVKIDITIAEDGTYSTLTVSSIEDYKHDYLYFKDQAIKKKGLKHKRYLRAAYLFLFIYFENVVGKWIDEKYKEDSSLFSNRREFNNFYLCMDKLTELAQIEDNSLMKTDYCFLKQLRNKINHYNSNDCEMFIFEEFTLELVDKAERIIFDWLEKVGDALSLEPHPDTRELVKPFLKGLGADFDNLKEDYSDPFFKKE